MRFRQTIKLARLGLAVALAGQPAASIAMDVLALPFEARIAVPPLLLLSMDGRPQAWQSSWPQAYRPDSEYEGYFHHALCYRHDAGRFVAAEEADADHYCAGKLWSGNLLNWTSMSALDTARYALMGGARTHDNKHGTVLGRIDLGKQAPDSFNKLLDAREVDIARLLPFDRPRIFMRACARRLQVWSAPPDRACEAHSNGLLVELDVRVRVCDELDQRPWLCKAYEGGSKPEGLLQASASWLRVALQTRDGSFLGGGLMGPHSLGSNWTRQLNPGAEWDTHSGVWTRDAGVLRQLSRLPSELSGTTEDAGLLHAALKEQSGLKLASCQRTHVLRWPDPGAAGQDGAAQLARLRRQFARIQLDYQRTALPAPISLAMNQDNALYIANTDTTRLSSTLRRYSLQASPAGKTVLPADAQWQASVPEPGLRQLFTTGTGANAGRLMPLGVTGLSTSQLQALRKSAFNLRPDGLLTDRLAWLRGASAVQESKGGKLADRPGSFAPQFGGNLAWMGSASGPNLVFMNTGDGLLHVMDADSGKERFAWMPSALLATLPAVAAPDFPAQSLLDGGIHLGSVAEQGKNLPVLAVGGGHSVRGVFVLKSREANLTDARDWRALEFTAADDERVGHVLQPPQVVRIATRYGKEKSRRPYLLFSSGVNGVAGLFLLALDIAPGTPWVQGSNYFFIPATPGQQSAGAHLAPATVVLDDEQDLRYAWAGDERGRLWRFGMVDQPKSAAGFEMTASQVFSATSATGDPQIISSAPRVAYGPDQSWLVMFGTGQWLEIADAAPGAARQESFYGLLDRPGAGIIRREALSPRRAEASANGYRVQGGTLAPNAPGWVFDFPVKGERVTQSPLLLDGRIVITSLIAPADPCQALAWRNWDLDALQGANALSTGRAVTRSLQAPLVLREANASPANAFGQRAAGLTSVFMDLPSPGSELQGQSMQDRLPVGRLAWREIHNWSRLHAAQSKP